MPELLRKSRNFKFKKDINEKLSKINSLEKEVSSFNTHKAPIYDKTVPKAAVDAFFKKLESGTFKRFFEKRTKDQKRSNRQEDWINKGKITLIDNRVVFPITKSILGTVRIFNKKEFNSYIGLANYFYNVVKEHKNNFEHFKIQPINILGIKELKTGEYAILEKVYPTISVYEDYSHKDNRYLKAAIRFLENRNLGLNDRELNRLIVDAHKEYCSIFWGIDTHESNILFLDYDPKTKKFLFGPIDFVGSTKSIP